MRPACCLAEEEQALEVGIDHRVPVVLGEVDRVGAADDAGVVDEDVDVPAPGDRLLHQARDAGGVAEVAAQVEEAAAAGAHVIDGVFRLGLVDADDVGAGFGERQRDRLADAGVSAGDDRHLAGEIEERAHASWQMSRTFMSV